MPEVGPEIRDLLRYAKFLVSSSPSVAFGERTLIGIMFKRVDKATGKRDRVDQLKWKTGDDTAVSIDQLADESSSSESDSDSESNASSSGDKKTEVTTKQAHKRKRTQSDAEEGSDASSGDDDSEDKEAEEAPVRLAHEGPAVTIDEALKDPIYVPTSGEKKHGVMASKCILCEKASLKSAHLVEEHLNGKSHKRRMERFTLYISEQMSSADRKSVDARDAVDDMDTWKAAQMLEAQKAASANKTPSNAAKKEKLRQIRIKKKKEKKQAKKEKAEMSKRTAMVEDPQLKKERKQRKYGDKKKTAKV